MNASVELKDMTFSYRDEFHRKTIAENIIKLLDADVDFCPMVIDGGWGTGKTEFCHKLINLIKEQDTARRASAQSATDTPPAEAGQGGENRPENTQQPERAVIYLDAFASETVDDPLLCILAAIRAEFPEEETRKKISQRAVPVVKTLCKVAGKAAFAHIFKQDIAEVSEELAEAASDGANTLIDQTVDKLLDQYADAQKNIEALQDVLTIAAATRPIIFFIDELDRCRPDFALSILELVKHVFEVPGIKFVFVANMEQLKAVIRKRYGQDVDADVYLEKFVNLSIVLPPVDNKTQQNAAYMLLEKELHHTGIFEGENNPCKILSLHLIEKHNIKLRGVEKLIKNIKIYVAASNKNPFSNNIFIYEFIFLLSMFIFTFNKELSHKIIIGRIDTALFDFVGIRKDGTLDSNNNQSINMYEDDTLENIIFIIVNIICYGYNFSFDKLKLTVEDAKKMEALLEEISYGLTSFYDFVKNYTVSCISTMNMLSIKW